MNVGGRLVIMVTFRLDGAPNAARALGSMTLSP
jgi:hypothetical protein